LLPTRVIIFAPSRSFKLGLTGVAGISGLSATGSIVAHRISRRLIRWATRASPQHAERIDPEAGDAILMEGRFNWARSRTACQRFHKLSCVELFPGDGPIRGECIPANPAKPHRDGGSLNPT